MENNKPKWLTEPMHHEFMHRGYPVLMVRHPENMHWCGYVGLKPGHPEYGKPYDDIDVHVHGGLTYGYEGYDESHKGKSYYKPKPWYWIGFDCAHSGDYSPGIYYAMLKAKMKPLMDKGLSKKQAYGIAKEDESVKLFELKELSDGTEYEVYRDMDYVIAECKALVDQLEGFPRE